MPTERPLVLIVDDEPLHLRSLAQALQADYRVQVTSNGPDALRVAAREPHPHLILLDVVMPDMDGYAVCRRLKADPRLRDIPVIFVTALSDAEHEAEGLALGAADYLTKSGNLAIARQRIANLLEREALRNRLEVQVQERTLALTIAKEAAEGALRAKTALLANLSHELRTPLNHILGLTELMRRRPEDPSLRGRLGQVQEAARRLLGLIQGLLDLTALEAHRLTVQEEELRLGDLAERLVLLFEGEARAKGLGWTLDLAPGLADRLTRTDPRRLGQVLQVLLENAIKFTEAGGVTLRIHEVQGEAGAGAIRFEVRDTGVGIGPELLPHLFSPFVQADGSATRRHGGAGLGLAIGHSLAARLGGRLEVQSTPGQGSRFRLTLPLPALGRREAPGAPVPAEVRLHARHAGARVLLVLADAIMAEIWGDLLAEAGLVAQAVLKPEAALAAFQGAGCDLLVIDVEMPGKSPVALVAALRALPGGAGLPVLAIGDPGSARVGPWLEAGMRGPLAPEAPPEALYEALLQALEGDGRAPP